VALLICAIHHRTQKAMRGKGVSLRLMAIKSGKVRTDGKSTRINGPLFLFSTPLRSVMGVSAEPGQKGVNWSNIAVGESHCHNA